MALATRAAHHEHVGQTTHAGRRGALVGALLLAGGLLAGCGTAPRATATTLRSAVDSVLVTPDGASAAARSGELIPAGDSVRTGRGGSAVLDTGGRLVWLAGDTQLQVRDGTDQSLDFGSVLVDSRAGPGLTMRSGSLTINPAAGSAIRVQTTYDTRVGALLGTAGVSGPGGSRQVSALHQLLATALALPVGDLPPLQLTDDRAEESVAPGLVADDEFLNAEAREIDLGAFAGGSLELAADRLLAAASRPLTTARASEAVLPLLIAEAAPAHRSLTSRYRVVLGLRAEGGSWGVIAHLVGARALRTTGGLQQLLLAAAAQRPAVTGLPGSGGSGGSGSTGPSGSGGGGSGSTGSGGSGGGGSGSTGSGGSGGGGSGVPSPGASPSSPAPSATPLPEPIASVVGSVSGLLPTLPVATPSTLVGGLGG
jgi:hypothetical protein